tara:strand:+ start:165 stop:671 length:507 start_codon:yes stop_codon:yes gene_type:complete
MFKKLGLKYRTKRASRKRSDLINQSEKKSQKVGIVTSKEIYKTSGFKTFIKKLSAQGMDTDILIFNEDLTSPPPSAQHYTKKDYSWSGKIKSPLVNKFIKTPFDFLFSVNTSSILHIENILALSKAKCRIGTTTHTANEHLDFMVKVKENSSIDKLTDSMLHYTEIQY